jgi:hypothetical protein
MSGLRQSTTIAAEPQLFPLNIAKAVRARLRIMDSKETRGTSMSLRNSALGTAEQTLCGVGHARDRAFESAWAVSAHAGDRAVVALLALYLLATAYQGRQHFVALFKLRHHAALFVQKWAQR